VIEPNYIFNIINIIKVIDGDTVDAMIDLGFNIYTKKRIRLMGINTPESRTRDKEEKKRGLAAKSRLNELLSENKCIKLKSYGVGKFGRVLGEIIIGDQNVNDILVSEGHAVVYHGGKR
jgi:micrococcal nuclease